MLVLINPNTMRPAIGPIGLDYIAGAVRKTATKADVLDLCLSDDPSGILRNYFAAQDPKLVGISFRNEDDCFWPSAERFVPGLALAAFITHQSRRN